MSKYHTELDSNNVNTSHAQILALVGANKRVLDVGCATGYLARELVAAGCTVSGVEYDADAAEQARPALERVMVADLETADLVAEFGREQFDAVVFGDVLEHLRDPLEVLRRARPLLARGGCVVISVPNVAHGAVRLALLQGRWEYRSLGLLDDTHLRFFTRASLKEMLRAAGLVAVEIRTTQAGLFETELAVKPEDYDQATIDAVAEQPDATTYQFVLKAVPDDADQAIRELQEREEQHLLRIDALLASEQQLQGKVAQLQQQVRDLEARPPVAPPPPPPPPPPPQRSRPMRFIRGVARALRESLE
ncbi:MAG TPA: class I SAM-dependent methyltransferase [Acidothermaceae bacterium]|nr:class I SAM-dependent methyltransferase [Acidothermaceae bacterium]